MVACLNFIKLYWKSLFILIYPFAITPIFLIHNIKEMRCLYVVILMAGFWIFELIPVAITALFPIVLFPLMGILDTKRTSMNYFHQSNMMFVGGLIVALAVEYCNLHRRISLIVIRFIGCSYRKLNFGLVTVTVLISWWISNTAAAAMMIPIVKAVLEELEEEGVGKVYEEEPNQDSDTPIDPYQRRPTRITMCFYMSVAYASTMGGLATVVGTGTNLAFKGIFETAFPDSPGIEFNKWIAANAPLSFMILYFTWVWLNFWYMGLFRPKSEDAEAVKAGKAGEAVARQVLSAKLQEMGKLSVHELIVAILFVLVVLLWFFRRPGFIKGWPEYITESKVSDATCAMIVVVLLFVLPARLDFIYAFNKDETKRPTAPSPSLITWRYVQEKMHWSLVLLLGGGYAIADGVQTSGMGEIVAERLEKLVNLPKFAIVAISCTMVIVLTQLTSNVAMANILLPIAASVARKTQMHPIYLMMPISLTCSFAFTLPVSTPPNAIAASACNMRTVEMIKVASVVEIIALISLLIIFPTWGSLFWDFNEFPDWANHSKTQ